MFFCSLVLMIHLCCILFLVICFLHFVTELVIAFDANCACHGVFKMSTAIVL